MEVPHSHYDPNRTVLLDGGMQPSVYETCRRLTGSIRCRTFVVVDQGNDLAQPIARFSLVASP